VLIALAITLPLLAALSALYTRIGAEHQKRREAQRALLVEAKVASLLDLAYRGLDSHRFALFPRVHRHGRITFSDQSELPGVPQRGRRRPNPQSDALSALRLDISKTLSIIKSTRQGSTLEILACPRYGQTLQVPDGQVHFIALSLDQIVELVGSMQARQGSTGCKNLMLRQRRSLTVIQSATDTPALNFQLLVPIAAHFTLYVDRNSTLRYLGQRGEVSVENQPVLTGISGLRLRQLVDAGEKVALLRAQLLLPKRAPRSLVSTHFLTRQSHLPFLLARP
jgi:hypothetical protein